ncbi:MAG: hypothetical protein A3E01_08275 [Gammaproteobacteria bacterium RIFCSPHIGHO2_12_FULL_63_22]|nr:MAG: hypothetical protein A3E01_08275 [Gammaproteobacteria bacterium RIFCSPHIGHO2_12_FULL_63_22]
MTKKRASKAKAERVKTPSKNEHGLTWQQESFAQLLASGRSQADAYRSAYPGSQEWKPETLHPAASKLSADYKVATRVKTLRAIITQQAIDEASTDKAWVMRRLKTVAERCLQAAPVLDKKGNPVLTATEHGGVVPAFEFNSMGANRSLELIGKENGMFIDRKEVGEPGAFDRMTDDELRRTIDEADAVIARARGKARDDRKGRGARRAQTSSRAT